MARGHYLSTFKGPARGRRALIFTTAPDCRPSATTGCAPRREARGAR